MKIETAQLVALVNKSALNGPTPKYQLIYVSVKRAIRNDLLPDLCELPATRNLAAALGLSRSTVLKAYELLKIEGYLEARVGSAYFIRKPDDSSTKPEAPHPPYAYAAVSATAKSFEGSSVKLNSIDDQGVAFRPGVPPLDLFPINQWKKLQNEYWQYVRASDLSYHSGAGIEALRKTLASYLQLRRGLVCDYRQIFVVGGSLQSLYLISTLLANPNDDVFVEDPTFPNVHSLFKGVGNRTVGVPLDREGIDLNFLEQGLTARSKFVHVTPACQYPLGIQMTHNRKKELLELANRTGLYIVENDYEHEINYPNHDGQTVYSLDRQDRSFYLSTFNRTLHPSVRVGFVVVPKHLISSFEAVILHSHRSISPALQTVLRGFIEKKYLHDHLKNVGKNAALRKQFFLKRLHESLSYELEPLEFDPPSLHLTALFKQRGRDTLRVDALAKNGVIAHALSKCYVDQPPKQGLIFGYSCLRPQHMEAHFDPLVEALKRR